MLTQKIIAGSVTEKGDIRSGSGFKVIRNDVGMYTIMFLGRGIFNSRPVVVATQNYAGKDDFNGVGGNTLDNVVIVAVGQDRVKLKTGNSQGIPEDRCFEFIAVGEVDSN